MIQRLIIEVIIVFVLIKLTTFGWRPSAPYAHKDSPEEKEIAQNLRQTGDPVGAGDLVRTGHAARAELVEA